MRKKLLVERAQTVLKDNDLGTWTRPAPGLYPHQWLWDSAFIAIGQSWYDPKRARLELLSLIRGQWANGMLPHMIFDQGSDRITGANVWKSKLSPMAPPSVETSGITQPPVVAEAVLRVGERMNRKERHQFYSEMFSALLRYHGWLYRERDPHNEGLVVVIHPWETGLDNSPPWIAEMEHNQTPQWIRLVERFHLDAIFNLFRQDTKLVPAADRISTTVSLRLFHAQRRLRRKKYNSMEILRRSHFSINDVFFNAILVRNNHLLQEIAHEIGETIPADLRESFERAKHGLEELWCEEDQCYYSRNFITKEWIREAYIGSLAPLYSGAISKERAQRLVAQLNNPLEYATRFPVPSVPLTSRHFHHLKYWQGPTWINTNWILIDGLRQYGYTAEAQYIEEQTFQLIEQHGFHEYFSPIDGTPSGAKHFSWTAALIIDLLSQPKK